MGKDVIVALDLPDANEVYGFLGLFGNERPFVKIGMELFYAEGPDIVRRLREMGCRIFLDLKLHDIPNTVGRAMERLTGLGVDMCNVHTAGGSKMMRAASEAMAGTSCKVIAVTQLTSTSPEMLKSELLIDRPMDDTVMSYAKNAAASGLAGVVCSPLEAGKVHESCGKDFITVTPGIRFDSDSVGDQVRVTTPARARELGSDYIVVGRPITRAQDPLAAYMRCVKEFKD